MTVDTLIGIVIACFVAALLVDLLLDLRRRKR